MSVAELERTTESYAKLRLTDADAHVDPPHTFWKEYLPEKFRSMAPEIEEGDEHDWILFEGRKRPLFILSNQAGREAKNYKVMGKLSDLHMSSTPDQRLKDMDLDGIETAILYGGGPLGTMDTDLYIESFRAYNRWLADFCKAKPDRLVGVAYLFGPGI